jgi:iron complex outermembrane receptor protein
MPDLASSVDNIQIQRGVGTSTNGAGAFGASMNIETNKLDTVPYGAISSSYGSFDSWKNTVEFGSGLIHPPSGGGGAFSFEGRLSKITSDGYIDRGTSDLKSFYLSGGYYTNNSSLRLIIFSGAEKTYQAWDGDPEPRLNNDVSGMEGFISRNGYNSPDSANLLNSNSRTYNYFTYQNQTDNYQQNYYQLLWNKAINRYWSLNAALHYTKGFGYYEEYQAQQSYSAYGLPNPVIGGDTISSTNLIRQRWLNNDFYGFTYSLNYVKNNFQFTLGGAGNQYKGRHYGTIIWEQYAGNTGIDQNYYNDTATKNDFNIFAKATYTINSKLHLLADMQYRTIRYSFIGMPEEYDTTNFKQTINLNFFNPKAGITYDVQKNGQVYASVGVGHKEPVRSDYVDEYEQGLPITNVKAEQMEDYEAGYRYASGKFLFNTNFYFMNYQDQLVLTGSINDVGDYIRQNVNNSYREGVEVIAGYRISKKVDISGNLTLSQNKIKEFDENIDNYDGGPEIIRVHDNTDISFSPSVIGAGIVGYSPIRALRFEFTSKYVGTQYLDNTSDDARTLNAYLLFDMHVSYTIHTKLIKEIAFKLMINNIFNTLYESNGATYSYQYTGQVYTDNYYYPQAGRNAFGGVSLRF